MGKLWMTGCRLAVCLALFSLWGAGCGGSIPQGDVSGKIQFNGTPIPLGSIVMVGADGNSASGNITNGEYRVRNVPVGDVRIAVMTHAPSPAVVPPTGPTGGDAAKTAKPIALPPKYNDAAQSGLKYSVKPGNQKYDLDLAP